MPPNNLAVESDKTLSADRLRASGTITTENIGFGVATIFLVLITHAIAYMVHEFAHTFMAWSLGWMDHPVTGIDYGHSTVYNRLFLGEVDDNVSYGRIFASGHGLQAAIIALSGPCIGSGLLYCLLYRVAKIDWVAANRWRLAFVYWLSLMGAANVWGYVPIRTLTTHADIALAAQGLQISTWVIFAILIGPALYLVYHFFCKMFPQCYPKITAASGNNLALMITVTSFWYFGYFGGDSLRGTHGLISQMLSIASVYFLVPVSAMFLASRYYAPNAPGRAEARI